MYSTLLRVSDQKQTYALKKTEVQIDSPKLMCAYIADQRLFISTEILMPFIGWVVWIS